MIVRLMYCDKQVAKVWRWDGPSLIPGMILSVPTRFMPDAVSPASPGLTMLRVGEVMATIDWVAQVTSEQSVHEEAAVTLSKSHIVELVVFLVDAEA